jgi:hypothetical protein
VERELLVECSNTIEGNLDVEHACDSRGIMAANGPSKNALLSLRFHAIWVKSQWLAGFWRPQSAACCHGDGGA